jgi:ketosteroid isomerase-like protein
MAKESTMNVDAAAIARASYEAYAANDRRKFEELLADDFHFTSPRDNRIDRATYFARCWPASARIQAFDFVHLVAAGERVFVTYEARAAKGRRFRNTEILTLRGRQIVEVEVYFGWSLPHEAPIGGFKDEASLHQLVEQEDAL